MLDALKYFEKIMEAKTGKSIDELRNMLLTSSPFYQYYLKLHEKDSKKGLVRLSDDTLVDITI